MYIHYKNVVCQDMIYTCAIKNIMELPQFTQSILNASGATFLKKNSGLAAQSALQSIGGQRGETTRARKSIAPFQLRKNNLLGCAVNLRGQALYSFLDQYITFVCSSLTPIRDNNESQFPRVIERQPTLQQGARYNFGGDSFLSFPGLQSHFLALFGAGGFNCTFCVVVREGGQLTPFLTALQIPKI